MSVTVFIQADGKDRLIEATVPEGITGEALFGVLRKLGIDPDEETAVLLDDGEKPVERKGQEPLKGIKRGCRIHVTRCQKVRVTAHFLDRTAHETFPAGARVRRVKDWAVREFKLKDQDAAEHVLQLCKSPDRPSTDTPLHELIDGRTCAVCFDLVPEKRVEG